VGQFEYTVDLSPVKPEDIYQLAKDFLKKKERDDMIKHEFGMLVLDATMSKEDQAAVDSFVHEQILKDRKRILDELDIYSNKSGSLDIAKFKLKQIINDTDRVIN
jgi:hypothetical protein